MTALEIALARVASHVRTAGFGFALVGGLAISVRAEPRMTRDSDLAVTVADDSEAERLIQTLSGGGYRVTALVEQEFTGRLATVRLVNDADGGLVSDLLFASSGIEPEIVSGAEELDVTPGLRLPVASVGHLIATKLLARDDRLRPIDADDLRALSIEATDDDWRTAAEAVRLIHERGYHRDRDLRAALISLRESGAY